MKRLFFLAPILVAMLSAAPLVFGQDEAAKPAYKKGDTWLFTGKQGGSVGSSSSNDINGTYELAMVDGKLKIFLVNGDKKDEVEPRPNALIGLLAFGRNLEFPLTVGKQWTFDYKSANLGGTKQVARKVTYEVKAIEQVTTQAGTFRAFKVESDDRAGPRDYWVTTYWYSPETRSIVKSQFDSTAGGQVVGLKREIELIKFNPAK